MIEIPDPPDNRACARCMSALVWLWSSRRSEWIAVSVVHDDPDPDLMRVHRCPGQYDAHVRTWRSAGVTPDPERARRGADLARRVLAGTQDRTEGEPTK